MITLNDDTTVSIQDLRDLAAEAMAAGDDETAAAALVVAGMDLDTPHLASIAASWPMPSVCAFEIVTDAYAQARAAAAE